MRKQFFIIIIFLYAILSIAFIRISSINPAYKYIVLEFGNTIMATLSLSSYFIVNKYISGKPQAFVRGVNAASLLKLFICMGAILVYVLLNRSNIHKATVFIMFGLYIVYTVAETWILYNIAKGDKKE